MLERLNTIMRPLDKFIIIAFFCSFVNSLAATAFCILLLLYIQYGAEGEVKILFWITIRGILNTSVAAGIGSGNIKWGILIGASLLVLIKVNLDTQSWKAQKVIIKLIFFCIVVGIASIRTSSYPVTASFKIIAFFLTFSAVIKGVSITRETCEWTDYLCIVLTMLMVLSFIIIPFGRFRIVNANFQGIFNHVNVMGIMCCMYLALLLHSGLFAQKNYIRIILIIVTFIMAFLSASRTGMASCIAVFVLYMVSNRKNFDCGKVALVFVGIFIIGCFGLVMGDSVIQDQVHNFVWKGNEKNIWESRREIIDSSMERYNSHKMAGTGFMVPYIQGIRDYSLKFDLIVEPGNMYYMLLADTGIVGLLLFVIFGLEIIRCGERKKIYLFVAAIMINFGEMGFFSSNNYSVLMYFLIAIYMFDLGDYNYSEISYQNME